MKSTISLIAVILSMSIAAFGQMTPVGPKTVKKTEVEIKPVVVIPLSLPEGYDAGSVEGNINKGTILSTLRWAERSSVACFPATKFEQFNGNHLFYKMTLPAASSIKIELTPKDGAEVNLYALRLGINSTAAPPELTSAISCEAKYPIYANTGGGRRVTNKDDGVRKIDFISIRSPYTILIGVAGANGLAEGAFDLKVEIKSR